MSRVFLFITSFMFLVSCLMAQDDADSIKVTTFRKGRNLVGIGGSVSSSILDKTKISSNPSDLGNNYHFDLKLGKFVADKNLVGLSFDASRAHLIGYIETIAEVLAVGPWYRYYIGKDPNLALYFQSTLQYSSYHGHSAGVQNLVSINEEIAAGGINGSLGLGICYAMADIITFEVGCDFHQGRFWGTLTDNALGTEQDLVLNRSKFAFTFGFTVLFGKLKEDD
ncbi:MAG: hypothetical protein KAI95_14180 [Bacteroidales bacterium]|nr:hypothetical protein [Bacteroidales bacterium]